jgi:hypothetical protein
VKQLLVEGAHRGEPLAGEFTPLHADDVEAFEHRMLTARKPERNDVAAGARQPAHDDLRADPGELVHRRQPANIDVVADLGVATERAVGSIAVIRMVYPSLALGAPVPLDFSTATHPPPR